MQYSNNILKSTNPARAMGGFIVIVFIMALLLSWSASSVTFKGFAAKGTEVAKGHLLGACQAGYEPAVLHLDRRRAVSADGDGLHRHPRHGGRRHSGAAHQLSWSARRSCPNPSLHLQRADSDPDPHAASIVWALDLDSRDRPRQAFCGVITQSICSIGMISKMYITATPTWIRAFGIAGRGGLHRLPEDPLRHHPQLTPNIISTVIYRF